MTKYPFEDEAALARQHTLEMIEVLEQILRDPNAPDEARRAAEQVLLERGLITMPDGPMRPCQVH
jgi:hypothetical protein